jgi:uncharacterized iron-regulated membrane protein
VARQSAQFSAYGRVHAWKIVCFENAKPHDYQETHWPTAPLARTRFGDYRVHCQPYGFETEIRSLYETSFTDVRPEQKPILPVSTLHELGKQALEKDLRKSVKADYQNVTLYRNPGKAAYYYAHSEKEKLYHYVYLNPCTGKVLKVQDRNADFFSIILDLHTSLLLPYEIGHQIVGMAVLVFVISLISGLILWFPASKKGMKQRFSVKWNAQWRRKNYDLHNTFGFYSFLLALVIALTGLVWSYGWFDKSVDWLANGGKLSPETAEPISLISVQKNESLVDRIFQENFAQNPDAQLFTVDFPTNDTMAIALGFYPSLTTIYDAKYLNFDQYSGKLLKIETWETKTNGQKMRSLNYDIHIGKILGLPGQLLAFCASLIAASLPVTGFLIWWGRRKKAKKNRGEKIVSSEKQKPAFTNAVQ